MTAAANILKYFYYFPKKIKLTISCESSAEAEDSNEQFSGVGGLMLKNHQEHKDC